MRKSRFVSLVIVLLAILTTPLTVYAQATTPAANPATAATPAATPAPLAIFTNYPAQVVGLGETATLPLKVRSGTPGTVDRLGTVLSAPNLHWSDVPLRELLLADLDLPVLVENDANAAVLAERRIAGGPDDLVRVQLSRGVGAGLLIGGRLVHGAASDAGEIGHVTIDNDAPRCGCGKIGCLETWASVPALNARIAENPGRRDEFLADAGHRLGRALAPVVAMLGLQRIVVGGPSDIVTDPLLNAARDLIVARTRSEFRPALELTASPLGEDAVLLGAADLVLLSELGVS